MRAIPLFFAAVLVSLGAFPDVREGSEAVALKSPVIGRFQGLRALSRSHHRSTNALGPRILVGKVGTGGAGLSNSAVTMQISDSAGSVDRTNNSVAFPSKSPWAGQKVLLVLGLKLVPILAVLLFVVVLQRWRKRRKPRANGFTRSRHPGDVRKE